jgi:aryl-alcohol dehydrogenase-like predicted oxidoreductase
MRYRHMGKTGLRVSELALGTMTFSGRSYWESISRLQHCEQRPEPAKAEVQKAA